MTKIAARYQKPSQYATFSAYSSTLVKSMALSMLRTEFSSAPTKNFSLVRHVLLKSKLHAQFMSACEEGSLGTLQLPPDFATRRLHQKAKVQRFSKALGEIARILDSMYIPFLAIKGPALSATAYDNIYAREFNDTTSLSAPTISTKQMRHSRRPDSSSPYPAHHQLTTRITKNTVKRR